MYKLLIFIHKQDNNETLAHFNSYTRNFIRDLTGTEIKIAEVESSLLLENKYSHFCEITVESKDKWDQIMNSKAGRILNKDLADFHRNITLIFVNYSG